jgi:hypothetical protein
MNFQASGSRPARMCQWPKCEFLALSVFDLPIKVRPHPNGDSLIHGGNKGIAISLCGKHSRYYRAMSLAEREQQEWRKPRKKRTRSA